MATLALIPPSGYAEVEPTRDIEAGARLVDVASAALERQLHQLEGALGALQQGSGAGAVHDARVATRRLRATLEMLSGVVWRPTLVRRLRRRLAVMGRALGAVRDADVFLRAHADGADSHVDRTTKRAVRRARRARKRARSDLAARLDSASTSRLLHRLRRLARSRRDDAPAGPGEPLLVRDRAGSLIWHRYETVRAHERGSADVTIDALHLLRVDVKHLRYALEVFEEALGPGTASLVADLVAVQDRLGEFHDAAVAVAHIDREDPSQELRLRLGHDLTRSRAEAIDAVAPVFDRPFRYRLLALVGGL